MNRIPPGIIPARPSDSTASVVAYSAALLEATRALEAAPTTGRAGRLAARIYDAAMFEARQIRALERRRN